MRVKWQRKNQKPLHYTFRISNYYNTNQLNIINQFANSQRGLSH